MKLHPTHAGLLDDVEAEVVLTDEQKERIARRWSQRYQGEAVYMPKRVARPQGNFVTSVRLGGSRPVSAIRDIRDQYGVSRRTAYRWIKK